MLKSYSKKKLIMIFEEIMKVLIADNEFHYEEIAFIVHLGRVYGIENHLSDILYKCLGVHR